MVSGIMKKQWKVKRKFMKKQAFTLIELMVVVAIIAILATLSVTSFAAAIKRTRNAGRQADMQAVAKAMETCYDVISGSYAALEDYECGNDTAITDVFNYMMPKLIEKGCLNKEIKSKMVDANEDGYLYTADCNDDYPQKFVVCAKLEKVANWGSVGNWRGATGPAYDDNLTGCNDTDSDCWFCIKGQQ